MDDLKQSVQNASYEQKDPLLIYKFEAFELFKATVDNINKEVLSFLFKGELPNQSQEQISEARQQKREKLNLRKDEVQNSTEQAIANSRQQQSEPVETIVRERPKIGRNEKVTIKNVMSGQEKVVKYKQAIPLIDKGEWVLTKQ
jgi:preprotein translocase subunit SecA